jgi:enoyl-CoA hydratase
VGASIFSAVMISQRAQKALLRQWEELPLKESIDLSIGVFGQSFLTGEPQRLMQGFIDRKR